MLDAIPEPGSFRDPSGHVIVQGKRVFRTVRRCGQDDFDFVAASGLLRDLSAKGWVIDAQEVDPALVGAVGTEVVRVLEHPSIPVISYPYEWTFSSLKAAALLHLDVHLAALERGVTLSDATAYNLQFIGPRPIFIDYLSFVRYREGSIWVGHKQFCEQFLNPLLLWAYFGVAPNSWFRGGLEGIPVDDMTRLLPFWRKLAPRPFIHLVLQSYFQRRGRQSAVGGKPDGKEQPALTGLPKAALKNMLTGLRSWIAGLEPKNTGTSVWQDYAEHNSYSSEEAQKKAAFIERFITQTGAKTVWDFGCNTGHYLSVALKAGASYGTGFDFDFGALERGVARATKENLPLQFLFFDAANPSPAQGWAQAERKGLADRASADALFALAFVHHLAIAKNIPLHQLAQWLTALAPKAIVEFVPKEDPMVQELLRNRVDIFPDYTLEAFRRSLSERCRIVAEERVSNSGRCLLWVERH